MLPSANWIDAMASTVSSSSAAVTTPSTSGRRCSRVTSTDLLRINDEALAEHRVERAVEGGGPAGLAHDLVGEEVVVSAHRPRAGVVEPEGALQPPVRRVQRVRVVRAAQPQAGRLELLLELVLAVDAHVTAGRVVVAVVDRPTHPFGPAGGHGDGHPAAGPQHPDQLADRAGVVPEVFEHLRRDDAVERGIG